MQGLRKVRDTGCEDVMGVCKGELWTGLGNAGVSVEGP